jgi:hypothetical protein
LLALNEAELKDPLGLSEPLLRAKVLGHLKVVQVRRARQNIGVKGGSQQPIPSIAEVRQAPVVSPSPRRRCKSGSPSASVTGVGFAAGGSSAFTFPGGKTSTKITVDSYFGTESGSPQRGTFSTASRAPLYNIHDSPGPTSYNTSNAERANAVGRIRSPFRATFGNAPRGVADAMVPPVLSDTPSPVQYASAGVSSCGGTVIVGRTSAPRATIGKSPRKTSIGCVDEASNALGPSASSADSLRTRRSSPRATMGTSARNTDETLFGVAAGSASSTATAVAAFARGSSYSPLPTPVRSPRIKGGVIASTGRERMRLSEDEIPPLGPWSYGAKDSAERARSGSPSATFGNASRQTTSWMGNEETVVLRFPGFSPSPRDRVRGGVISTAPRWQARSQSNSASPSPGPATYKPRANATSTFR